MKDHMLYRKDHMLLFTSKDPEDGMFLPVSNKSEKEDRQKELSWLLVCSTLLDDQQGLRRQSLRRPS